MFIAGTNFVLSYFAFKLDFKRIFRRRVKGLSIFYFFFVVFVTATILLNPDLFSNTLEIIYIDWRKYLDTLFFKWYL